MNTEPLTGTVGASVIKDSNNAEVLRQLSINFRYGGNKDLEETSKDARVITEHIKASLEQNNVLKTTADQEFNKWDTVALIDYIINTHHRYAKENAGIIYDLAQKVSYQHSKNHPELTKLTTAIFLFLHNLLNHMKKEEQILFPNIKQLVKKRSHAEKIMYTTFGLIKESVIVMKKEHQAAGKDMWLFHELTNDYMLPEDGCSSYKYLFVKMKEFEDDLLLHVHLEDNVLFPRAIAADEVPDENEFVNVK